MTNKKELKFSFDVIFHEPDNIEVVEERCDDKTFQYKLNKYELNKLKQSTINSYLSRYYDCENSPNNILYLLRSMLNDKLNVFSNKYDKDVEYIENYISNIPQMEEALKKYESTEVLCKNTKVVFNVIAKNDLAIDMIKKLIKKSLNETTKDLKKSKNLKKAFYTENLYFILDKFNIKDKKIRDLAELSLFSNISSFRLLSPYNLHSRDCFWTNAGKMLNREYQTKDVTPYINKLFCFDYNYNGQLNWFTLKEDILNACFNKYKNQKDCINLLLNKASKEDLSEEDFNYVKQYAYIKDLLKNALLCKTKGVNILLYGKPGTGKTAMAKVLMQNLNADCYEVITNLNKPETTLKVNQNSDKETNVFRINNYFTMQSILDKSKNNLMLYDEAEDFFRKNHDADQSKGIFNSILENNSVPTIWTTNDLYCIESSFLRRFTYILNIDHMSKATYQKIISRILDKKQISITSDINELLLKYRPSIGITEKLLNNYKNTSMKSFDMFKQDLLDTLKGVTKGESVAKLPINSFKFNQDLVNADVDIKQLTDSIKESGRLDFSLLLYGCPGSSKTSYGRYLAEELGLDVISKSYTELSSMWVGETEKNIARLFEQAEAQKALIILDECDVLLRDRTSARASWEISQTEALLTAMEFHPYPFVMTTNLFEHLDQAVMRRILYKIKFDYLKPEQIKIAFKHFFNINIEENLHLSRLTSGDFAIIKKQAEFQNKLNDKDWLINRLTIEMEQKKRITQTSIKL